MPRRRTRDEEDRILRGAAILRAQMMQISPTTTTSNTNTNTSNNSRHHHHKVSPTSSPPQTSLQRDGTNLSDFSDPFADQRRPPVVGKSPSTPSLLLPSNNNNSQRQQRNDSSWRRRNNTTSEWSVDPASEIMTTTTNNNDQRSFGEYLEQEVYCAGDEYGVELYKTTKEQFESTYCGDVMAVDDEDELYHHEQHVSCELPNFDDDEDQDRPFHNEDEDDILSQDDPHQHHHQFQNQHNNVTLVEEFNTSYTFQDGDGVVIISPDGNCCGHHHRERRQEGSAGDTTTASSSGSSSNHRQQRRHQHQQQRGGVITTTATNHHQPPSPSSSTGRMGRLTDEIQQYYGGGGDQRNGQNHNNSKLSFLPQALTKKQSNSQQQQYTFQQPQQQDDKKWANTKEPPNTTSSRTMMQEPQRIAAPLFESRPKKVPQRQLYNTLLRDPAYGHAIQAGFLWQSLVGQHMKLSRTWWNGQRGPPLGNPDTQRPWMYVSRDTVPNHRILRQLVRGRASAGRVLLHLMVQDVVTGATLQDIAIGCYHPMAKGIRETERAIQRMEEYRDVWVAVRKHSEQVSAVESSLLLNLSQPKCRSPLGPGRRVGNTNVRAVFGDRPPLETVRMTEDEVYDRVLYRMARDSTLSASMAMLQEFVFA